MKLRSRRTGEQAVRVSSERMRVEKSIEEFRMQIVYAIVLHLITDLTFTPLPPAPPQKNPKKEVLALFEEYEKKRETKWPTLRARL